MSENHKEKGTIEKKPQVIQVLGLVDENLKITMMSVLKTIGENMENFYRELE